MVSRRQLAVVLFLGVSLGLSGVVDGQDAPGFKNLQVLDPAIAKKDLKATMEGFVEQLGVRCTFCHVPDEYHKDDLEQKQVARKMVRLVKQMRAEQEKHFKSGMDAGRINCWLCHRGKAEPEQPGE